MFVRFRNFWPGFIPEDSFFWKYLVLRGHHPVLCRKKREKVDLEFISVFPSIDQKIRVKFHKVVKKSASGIDTNLDYTRHFRYNTLTKRSKSLVWFTGENVRAPFDEAIDLTLSFEEDGYHGNNVYFPLWFLSLNLLPEKHLNSRAGVESKKEELLLERAMPEDFLTRSYACAFVGNPHSVRMRAIREMELFGDVEIFGRYVSRPVKYKSEVANNYKFMFCFENDLYPGYVTEKLIDAYVSGCIPLYWGDLGLNPYFNENSFINLRNFRSITEFSRYVSKLSSEQLEYLYRQPLLKKLPTLDCLEPLDRLLAKSSI